MCFSKEASFGIAAALVPAGIYCINAALKKNRAYLGLSAIPLFFGVLELAEGVAWAGFEAGRADLVRRGALGFLFFALAVWPTWIPFSGYLLEARPRRKMALGIGALLGLGWFLVFYYPIASDPDRWLTTRVVHHSIAYDFSGLPIFRIISETAVRWLYTAIVSVPLLLQADRRVALLGAMLGLSSVLTYLLFAYAFASIWCFFAAILSLYLCHLFYRLGTTEGEG